MVAVAAGAVEFHLPPPLRLLQLGHPGSVPGQMGRGGWLRHYCCHCWVCVRRLQRGVAQGSVQMLCQRPGLQLLGQQCSQEPAARGRCA